MVGGEKQGMRAAACGDTVERRARAAVTGCDRYALVLQLPTEEGLDQIARFNTELAGIRSLDELKWFAAAALPVFVDILGLG